MVSAFTAKITNTNRTEHNAALIMLVIADSSPFRKNSVSCASSVSPGEPFPSLQRRTARAEAVDPATSPFAAVGKQYIEAYNRKDAAAVAALFADDAVRVTDRGIIQGRDAVQKSTEAGLEAGGHDLRLRYNHTHIDGNT